MSAGILSQISFAKETTWGTAVTPNKSLKVRPTGGIEIKNNLQPIPAIRGQVQKYYDTIKGKVAYEGAYTFDAFGDYLGYFLLSALGVDTPVLHSGETTVYDHVFSEAPAKPSFTIEQAISENVRRYAGAMVNSLKITGKTGDMVEVEANVIAKGQTSSSQITGAFPSVPAFNHAQVACKIGGTLLGEVTDFELTYKSGLDMVYALGSTDPQFNSIAGGSEVDGKITLYLDAAALTRFNNYVSKTSESIELIMTGGVIGSAANYVLDIVLPRADYKTAKTPVTDGYNMVEIEFTGIYDIVTSKLIGITLTNLLASY